MSESNSIPSILMGIGNPDDRAAALAVLGGGRYVVDPVEIAWLSNGEPVVGSELSKLARTWIEEKRRVVILDYVAEDAKSVKLLQAATDLADAPKFIFVLSRGENIDQAQLVMTMNEGAWAILPAPLDASILANYVERALAGPGRFRHESLSSSSEREGNDGAAIAKLEERVRQTREKTLACERLISRIMSTPVSEQARRALIVSDSLFQRDQLEKTLVEHGYQVFTAANAADGMNIALRDRPRIVVSDLELEDSDGVSFCRALKIEEKYVPCHFVVCTANKDKIARVLTPGNGVDDCMAKPSSAVEILDFVARVSMGLLL